MEIRIGIIDDHQLFLKSLSLLVNTLPEMHVVLEALNGKDMIAQMKKDVVVPDIMIIDVNMPEMNGPETTNYVKEHYPEIKCVALSMNADDASVIRKLRAGCCAYLLKDVHPNELETALRDIYDHGYYNAETKKQNKIIKHLSENGGLSMNDKEAHFLQLACSDMTYKQIAENMQVAERTIDGYRESLFKKLEVTSRVGMVLEAIRRNLVHI